MRDMSHKIGETSVANNGMKMTLIKWNNKRNVDVQFEDGVIIKAKEYYKFKLGKIGHPTIKPKFIKPLKNDKIAIGETNTATNGQMMKIIAYRNYKDIDIEFEDGTQVTGKDYGNFKRGVIENPNLTSTKSKFEKKYIGLEKVANNGQKMTIIGYRNSQDINIQFEDGTIIEHTRMIQFKRGKIGNPNYVITHEGEEVMSLTGLKMKITKYVSTSDVNVKFEDGTEVYHTNYFRFKKGRTGHPKFKLNYVYRSDNYFGYQIKPAFNYKDTHYYFAKPLNSEYEIIMTLQEIYKMAVKING